MKKIVKDKAVEEKIITPPKGVGILVVTVLTFIVGIALSIIGIVQLDSQVAPTSIAFALVGASLVAIVFPLLLASIKIVYPNEALVLGLFGSYYGTIKEEGIYSVNPFCSAINPTAKPASSATTKANNHESLELQLILPKKNLSLKAMTLNNAKQKVNDLEGNPIEIGVVVIWKIVNTAKAVFNVDNYINYVSTQADGAIRQVSRLYPYDISEQGEEKSLRGSSQEIAEVLKKELQERVEIAGIEIVEARIAHLAYAQEIAAVMLQRQQAAAIVMARQKIVEGAVGMVEMALNKLNENQICNLDEERKAQMVCNLLVVLCGNKDAQPIVNSGSIY